MGGSCCCPGSGGQDEDQIVGKKDISEGPAKNRGCTDAYCVVVYIASWIGLLYVTSLALAEGSPKKLIMPRDYQGAYCDIEKQWNDGPSLVGAPKLIYMMDISATADVGVKTLLCSSPVEDFLKGSNGMSPAELAAYDCACCNVPCDTCQSSHDVRDYSTVEGLASGVRSMMADLTDPDATGLFRGSGLNGDLFSQVFQSAHEYFVKACVSSCDLTAMSRGRNYTYMPAPTSPMRKTWEFLLESSHTPSEIKETLNNAFTFRALDKAHCPYDAASKCVPYPGITFEEMMGGYCRFHVGEAAENAIGKVAAEALEGSGITDLADTATDSMGTWVGELENAQESIILVSFLAFVVGIVFCLLMRFFLKLMVYLAILIMLLLILLAGGLAWVRSGQCVGAGLFETGKESAFALMGAAAASARNTIKSGELGLVQESLSGKGKDYRGFQTRTKSGKLCVDWESGVPDNHTFNNATYPNAGLTENHCRNPVNASTIWCFTADPVIKWETCYPLGVLQPECAAGYEVESTAARKTLRICAYVLWGLGLIYLLLVWCLRQRIKLAIGVNQVAAHFIMETPSVFIVPVVQSAAGIIWVVLWVVSACFLLSQVPKEYTPTEAFATYAEAYGTEDVKGKCTDTWPAGNVYADNEACEADAATGEYKCWRCYPPRFTVSWRFAYSFFCFLWNNAFLVAFEECVIAGAVAAWFFAVHGTKKSTSKVRKAVWHVVRYHSGSLLLGSFIIAVVQFIRFVMMYLEKQAQAQKNRFAAIVLRVLQCCTWCVEQCLKFLNKNAYIQIALVGTNFCTSAKRALLLIVSNVLRFGTVLTLGWVVQRIGLWFITIATAAAGYFIMKELNPEANPVVPMVVFAIIGYVVGRLFMAVFQLAVDTSLQCFLVVEEMGGEPADENRKYVPKRLLSLLPTSTAGREEARKNSI